MVRVVLIFFIVCSSLQFSHAQSGTVTGVVSDEQQQPVEKVSLHVLNTNITLLTNAQGQYRLPAVPLGKYILSVTGTGYAASLQNILVSDTMIVHNIVLHSSVHQLDDVTVTAEKREEQLQQLPLSVSALTARQVTDYRLWNSSELTAIVPSLYTDNPGDGRNVTSIRGIVTTSYEPAVVTYVDGVNQFSLDTYIGTLSDVERIEVLRGPQGTLYGRNAMGGVINIITKQPTNQTRAFAEINIGNYGLQRYVAGIRTALVKDKLYAGVSLLSSRRNGYYDNRFTGKSFDQQQLLYGNYYLKYLPANKWMLTLNVKHQSINNDGAFPLVYGVEEALSNPFMVDQNAAATMKDHNFNTSLVISYAGNRLNVNATSSYQTNYRYYDAPLDADFSPADIVSIINNYGKPNNLVNVLTQEIRITSAKQQQKLQYTAGTYFFYQNSPTRQATFYGKDAGIYGVPDIDFASINTSKAKGAGAALYGQLKYALTSKLSLIGGIRFDYEHRRLSVKNEYQKGSEVITLLPDTAATVSFHSVSPKLSLQYVSSPNSQWYVSYSKGYRAGGLSPLSDDPSQPPLYQYLPENSYNVEVGSKHVLFHHRLFLNLAAYTTFVHDVQVPTLVLPAAITLVKNTGKLVTRGLEAELSATPVKGLKADVNAGIIHTSYQSLKLSQNGAVVDLGGKRQIYTPAATSMVALQYSVPIMQVAKLVIRGEWQYRGTTYFDVANTISQSAYHLFNARVGIDLKHLELYAWCRNAFDKNHIAFAYDFGAVHLGEPRTFGITARINIGKP